MLREMRTVTAMVERGPFGLPAMPAGRKLAVTIGMSLLGLLSAALLIFELAAGSGDWPNYLVGMVVMAVMIVLVRRVPTKG